MKRLIIIVAAVTVAAVVFAACFIDRIPPRALTATRMHGLKRWVLQYTQSHGQLPASLTALPTRNEYDNSIKDGWNSDIAFEVSASGLVSYRSLGQDGAVGGCGEDADIERPFPARDTQGKWHEEPVAWSADSINL